jgi:UDP-hydrolysing UDP-N-acetyl-D-glucosamine 2-epimerase
MTGVVATAWPAPRSIAVLTSGRQDWGIVHSTCAELMTRPDLRLRLMVGGTHWSRAHGLTVEHIRSDGFEPDDVLDWLGGTQAQPADAQPADAQAAAALASVGAALRARPAAALLLAGDRFETAAAAIAATVNRVPIVHLHGGEQTLGAFDDALRHAVTKLSHLHLVSSLEHARRVVALGEDPGSVHVVGAPGLDAAFRGDLPDRDRLESELGVRLVPPVVIVTVQPTTLDADPTAVVAAVVSAMDAVPATYVITMPNTDPGAAGIRERLSAAIQLPGRVAIEALGERRYWGLMRIADAMLGNSSSALIEAPVLDLPAVNVGDRQAGRHHGPNVIDTGLDDAEVGSALRRALDPTFRAEVAKAHPTLADGLAGRRIADIIAAWRPMVPPRKPPIPIDP